MDPFPVGAGEYGDVLLERKGARTVLFQVTLFGRFDQDENDVTARAKRDAFVHDLKEVVDGYHPYIQSAYYNGTELGPVDLLANRREPESRSPAS